MQAEIRGSLFVLLLGVSLFAAASAGCSANEPNIVLIHVDDLGYNDVGFNGAVEISTPHIDRLAREGVIFANGYAAASLCSPSRVGLMTGRYPDRFGVVTSFAHAPFDHAHGLPLEATTFATHLRNAGYRTGLIGKWHLGSAPPFHPLNRGFDSFFGFLAGGHDYYRIDVTDLGSADQLLPLGKNRGATGFTGYLTDALTDAATAFIRGEAGGAPFFLYLAYNAPHTPLQAPAALVEKYAHVADENRRKYLAMVDALDSNVGRVLDTLEETGQRHNTLVFFLSDNGGMYPNVDPTASWADNRPFRHGKGDLFEGGIRVPFVGSWPARWPRGATFEPMVINLDIAATALAAANVRADSEQPLEGVDLDPFVRGTASGPPHEALFWRLWNRDPSRTAYAVRAGDLKLVKGFWDGGDAALYDLQGDPGETHDRIDEDPEAAARLAARWNDWNRQNVGRRFGRYGSYRDSLSDHLRELAERHETESMASNPFQIGEEPPRARWRWTPSCSNGVVVREPERNPGLVADCEALRGMLDTLTGFSVDSWNFRRPIRSWDGVTVGGVDGVDDAPARVRELRLPIRGLTGSFPLALKELDGLEVLDLRRNRLTGGLPSWLGDLTGLRVVVLSYNDLSGPLPPELGRLSNLEELWLKGNRLTGAVPREWGGLSSLRLIRLAGNSRITCIPPALQAVESHDFQPGGILVCPGP